VNVIEILLSFILYSHRIQIDLSITQQLCSLFSQGGATA